MFQEIKWLFFDVGSTLINEQAAYEYRLREIASLANTSYEKVYEMAVTYYKQNKKGDLETATAFGIELPAWHKEDEFLYDDTVQCLEVVSRKYKTGIIANQPPGKEHFNLVIASAEEGVAKPDRKLFEIALQRSNCEPIHAIMIGDRIDNDIVPANSMGMHTIWIRRGFGQYWNIRQEIEKPDFIVNNLTELCNIL